ncbi:MAG: hypothetical protein B7Y25_06540 [Alphaproteobacteria bacterium 16-39-46]|nr:MAG: hypothetical protein B7Y25_06540 [Alphaproteobacteria bacterium 16-39-46]OZA42296.1 MAG: hypothetical protein B7X84_06615 [Alphaproteobacteria bacterium 17-39-52]HQS84035.1 translesion error-prone DNA polymerase V autoproteolytic subunit [Alphaproteobacteria bacterium]HQS93898.1 translesion error-prone DNA polymerase V autoproteolytic subunit [Alphaproteobacteria bacterium]
MSQSSCFVTDIQHFSDETSQLPLPLYASIVPAGFPFHGDDHSDRSLDLNDYLVKNKASTFFVRVSGSSMKNAGIQENDILVVDRSIPVQSNQIVIAAINGELTVKRFKKDKTGIYLDAENPLYAPIHLRQEEDLLIWGVVTSIVRKL